RNGVLSAPDGSAISRGWREYGPANQIVEKYQTLWSAAGEIVEALAIASPKGDLAPSVVERRGPSITYFVDVADIPADDALRALLKLVHDEHPKLKAVRSPNEHFAEFKNAYRYVAGLNRLSQPHNIQGEWLSRTGESWSHNVHNAARWIDKF